MTKSDATTSVQTAAAGLAAASIRATETHTVHHLKEMVAVRVDEALTAKWLTEAPAYEEKRDFSVTPEPRGSTALAVSAPVFVVQKHAARRLHWDFRLEYGGVLWSWAVPGGPSLDPADKRLAVRTEDHPLEYARFEGIIPPGNYGAGTVDIWDSGTWSPRGDPARDLEAGVMKFNLHGERLRGGFALVRLKPKPGDRSGNWLLVKELGEGARRGGNAAAIERDTPFVKKLSESAGFSPPPGAAEGAVPPDQKPQLASEADEPPAGDEWLNETKFDGYRVLVFKSGDHVRITTRSGQDWTAQLPALAHEISSLQASDAVLDGELVALREDGVASFVLLQKAMAEKRTSDLKVYFFDLLQLDGWDLRACRLGDRKSALRELLPAAGSLLFSEHTRGDATEALQKVCQADLEGVISKRADAPYRGGRGRDWLKLLCHGREEFVVLGWAPPEGSRVGIGSLHLGYYDEVGDLQYAGAVGTGFTHKELAALRERLDQIPSDPLQFRYAGEPPASAVHWVKPELVAAVKFIRWSGSGKLRHPSYLGLQVDKLASEVVRPMADPSAPRYEWPRALTLLSVRKPISEAVLLPSWDGKLTTPEREIWPGVSKQDLAAYWAATAAAAGPGIFGRPLAIVRCPDGYSGQQFFQKHLYRGFPPPVSEGEAFGQPYLLINEPLGLQALVQMSTVEVHSWGSTAANPSHPDRVVFDLDPGDGARFEWVAAAAIALRARLAGKGMISFCRTTGSRGLHVVAPLAPGATWKAVRDFAKVTAEDMGREEPERYISVSSRSRSATHILIDWLRNNPGATSVVSFSPRAVPGARVATPLYWHEVTGSLDPSAFTVRTVPQRLRRQRFDPWAGFLGSANELPPG